MTPRQFIHLRDLHEAKIVHDERMLGQVAQVVVNYGFCRPKKWVQVEDFMPSQWGKEADHATEAPDLAQRVRLAFASAEIEPINTVIQGERFDR